MAAKKPGKKKPDRKVDRNLGKPTTQKNLEKAHNLKSGKVEDITRKVEHRPSVAQEKAAKEAADKQAAAAAAAASGGGCAPAPEAAVDTSVKGTMRR